MADLSSSNFGVLDYCLFAGVLIISGVIGLYTSWIGNKSPEEFLMGNRNFKTLPVTLSLLTSFISATSLLGFSGEAYAYGIQMSLFVFGVVLGIKFSTYFILPILYPLRLTSINEYIELRFNSKRLRVVITVINLVKFLMVMGALLYAPTIALAHVTKLSVHTNILLLGTVCTLYSSFGGIRAVVWTDVFQLVVMMVGLLLVVVVGSVQSGGFIKALYVASEGGRMEAFNMNPSPFVRLNFYSAITFGFFVFSRTYSSEQILIQRICTVPSIKKAKRVMEHNIYGMFVIYFLIFTGGLIAYASYVGCDPMALGLIKKKEGIMPHFINDKLSFIPGLPGIFVATIICGTLSSLSSVINGCVAMIWKDGCLRFSIFQNASTRFSTLLNKILSFIVGAIIILLAILASYARSALDYQIAIAGTLSGPIFGVYLVGYFLPKCNIKGVWTGFIVSTIISVWIAVCGLLYKNPTKMLPFSAEECGSSNFTLVNISTLLPLTPANSTEQTNNYSFFQPLFQISHNLYGPISTVLCIIVAVLASLLTGGQIIGETSPRYISPFFHKFYWRKEELRFALEKDRNLNSVDIPVEQSMPDQLEAESMLNSNE